VSCVGGGCQPSFSWQAQFNQTASHIWHPSIHLCFCLSPNHTGACKILFRLPLIYFILIKYFIASCLTVVARESVTAVAWDSAGEATVALTRVAACL
jgi:hypothetical protein